MPRSLVEYLQHILDEIEYLSKTALNIDKDTFLKDETLRRSFVRSIEIIGEAVSRFLSRREINIRKSNGVVLPA
jgi:uncharacterized protein with HEPN domain